MKKVLIVVSFILLVYLSFFPRVTEVISGNYLFGYDQGRDYLAAWSIIKDHKLTLIGSELGAGSAGFSGIFHGPFHYYMLSLFLFLFNGDPYGGVVLMFVYSLAAIVLGFYIGKRIYDSLFAGIITALLLAVSPPLISTGRFVWNPHAAPFLTLVVFYFVYSGIARKGIFIFLSSFFAGFIYNFQTAIAIPLSLVVYITYFLIVRIKKIKEVSLLLLGSIAAFAPFLLFELRHSFLGTSGVFAYIFQSEKNKGSEFFLKNTLDHLGMFLFNFYDTFPKQDLIPNVFILLFVTVGVIIVLKKEKNLQRKKFILFLVLQPLIAFFVFLFLKNAIYTYYLLNLNVVYIFLFSYILAMSYGYKNKILFFSGAIILVIFIFSSILFSVQNFSYDYNDYGGNAKIKGKIDAIDYIYKSAKGERFGLLVFSPPVYTYPYDYIVKWYGARQYNFIPSQEKTGLYFLLIEKDPAKPWSYKGWLDTVVGTEGVIEEKILPKSGFIIQKRFNK